VEADGKAKVETEHEQATNEKQKASVQSPQEFMGEVLRREDLRELMRRLAK